MIKKIFHKLGWKPFDAFILGVTFIGLMTAAMVPVIETGVEKFTSSKQRTPQPVNLATEQPKPDAQHE